MAVSRIGMLLAGTAILGIVGFWLYPRSSGTVLDVGREALGRVYGEAGRGDVAEAFLADAKQYLERESKNANPLTLHFLDTNFGLPETHAFSDWLAQFLIHRFAMSCTVVAAQETGEPVEYVGFFDPLDAPCSNQLSAFNAP